MATKYTELGELVLNREIDHEASASGSNAVVVSNDHLVSDFESLLDEFWEMRELHPDIFKGALLNRLREFSKKKR